MSLSVVSMYHAMTRTQKLRPWFTIIQGIHHVHDPCAGLDSQKNT